ncbi:CDP-diacylglycerol--serine O-phosphatidyltransferase [Bacteroidia bacterium]|nr:CDP-diacylglycerol--serine O-phosphatidyltransferase [Bacteroidia bacterium]
MIKHIPNTITCLNLLAGSLACVMALKFNNYEGAFVFICMAAVFDFLDGFAARLLHAYSNIGAELDSLSDVVSFGLAPGCVVYSYLATFTTVGNLPLIGFVLPVFAALRLAKFNVDTRQTTSFLGLPVPANGLFWTALIPSLHWLSSSFSMVELVSIVVLLVIFSLLMVSEIPMFSLKFKNLKWQGNEYPLTLVLISLILLIVFSWLKMLMIAVSVIIVVYILLSIIKNLLKH